jgi:glutamyl-tRNA reductase
MEDILLVHRKSSKNFAESLQDAAVWKTCLRQILFCREDEVNNFLEVLEPEDTILRGEEGLSLLLEILCGLHSPIVGETEVFGQFRQFIDSRKTLNDTLFADNQKWLNFIMAEVKKTRAEHLVGIGSQSYGSLLRRYSKDMDSVTICGSGQLAQEILPWVAHKRSVQVLCRECTKMRSFAEKFDNLSIVNYNEAYVHGEAMVIAAPLSDARILELIAKQDTRPVVIYDLRGEENNLPALIQEKFPRVTLMTLQQFFAEIEETKKDRQTKIQQIKEYLMEKALAFAQRTELRPLGWDDICA